MLLRKLRLLLLGGVLVWPLAGRASVLTYVMEGPITIKDDRLGLLDFVHVNDRMVYTFSLDASAPDNHPDPTTGSYDGLSASLHVGETASFTAIATTMTIYQPSGLNVGSTMEVSGQSAHLMVTLEDLDRLAIQSPTLPTQAYDLAQFETKRFSFYVDVVPPVPPDTYFTRLQFWGDIDRFYLVPEPASLAVMAGLGLAALIGKRR